jgi:hypothetical protein
MVHLLQDTGRIDMCWHKWSRWSTAQSEDWIRRYTWEIEGHYYVRLFQNRTCLKCGKYQKKYIN